MIVFVHGVPETSVIWRKVREGIGGASTALELPGFGCPRPDGFTATKDAYVDWLVGALSAIDAPIDLVGHDWGAPLVYRVASTGGAAVRSWAIDVAGLMHPDYMWHDFAKIWQTPGEGEAFIETQNAQPVDERAGGFGALFGLSDEDALEMSAGSDATMGACILDLYRSAVPNVHADWGPLAPIAAPGLVVHATGDPFGNGDLSRDVAAALGARYELLEGAGHFWPYSAPELAVPLLESFWSSLD